MTERETMIVLSMLETNYPMTKNREGLVLSWKNSFADIPYPLMMKAAECFMNTNPSPFFPTIHQIRAIIDQILNGFEMSGAEAWKCISHAVEDALSRPRAAYAALPEILQEITSPTQLKAFAMMNECEFQTVAQSNFLKQYEAVCKKHSAIRLSPEHMREQIRALEAKNSPERLRSSEEQNAPSPVPAEVRPAVSAELEEEDFRLLSELRLREARSQKPRHCFFTEEKEFLRYLTQKYNGATASAALSKLWREADAPSSKGL